MPEVPIWISVLNSLDAGVAVLDGLGRLLTANSAWRRIVCGGESCQVNGCDPRRCFKELSESPAGAGMGSVLQGVHPEYTLAFSREESGGDAWYRLRATACDAPGLGRAVVTVEKIGVPTAEHLELQRQLEDMARAEAFEADRGRVLELVARNELLETVLVEIVRMLERRVPGLSCAIALLRDGDFEVLAGRGLNETAETVRTAAAQAVAGAGLSTPALAGLNLACTGPAHGSLEAELIRGSAGDLHGVLLVSGAGPPPDEDRARAIARALALAGVAVDHTRTHQRLSFQGLHDPLTGLPNRLLFQDRLQQAINSSRRDGGGFVVGLVDLDDFRRFHDLHGTRVRDAVLREVAQRLQACMAHRDTAARSGSDEFLLLLQTPESVRDPAGVARRIAAAFGPPLKACDGEFHLTCTIGMSRYPRDGGEAAELVSNAGTALYEARQSDTGNFRFFEPGMGVLARERSEIDRCLREALSTGELELHYQPQFDHTRQFVACEALLRWNSPVLGQVPPAKFIPVAEQTGQIVSVGSWALRRACMQSVRWRQAGLGAIRMAVNVSTLQLVRPDFADSVAAVLAETGMHPSLLELEVTESAVIRNLRQAIDQVERLRRFGVSISVDDFGTGYSSLGYIQSLPVDAIKIDRCFVAELDKGSHNCDSIVRAILSLAHSLGIRVVAEGVETEGQFRRLRSLRCDLYQGYLLARPLPPARIHDMLQAQLRPDSSWSVNRDILAPEASS